MKAVFDTNNLLDFDIALSKALVQLDNKQIATVMMDAVKPLEQKMRQMTPRGPRHGIRFHNGSNLKYLNRKKAGGRYNTNLLFESTRIRNVTNIRDGARVIVGDSKKRGQAGWRAHFIDRGFTSRKGKKIAGKHYSEQALKATENQVNNLLGMGISVKFKQAFN